MDKFLKAYWKTLVFFAVVGLVGGFFTGLYVLDSYPAELRQQLVEELQAEGLGGVDADLLMAVVTAVQAAGYGLILGAVGIWLGKQAGLWKDETALAAKPLCITFAVAVVGGLVLILSDLLYFGRHVSVIMDSYGAKPTIPFLLASVLYGGVIEEVMLRLFFMSLFVWLLHKLFGKGREKPAQAILAAANVATALLFAAGHLPATAVLIGLSPMVVFRCFLLNGGCGLLFGWLYRKYGLRYAMLAHGGCHVVSKLIWILFL